jgi:MFS family permease
MHGAAGADWLIGFRLVQGVGAAFLIANSAAILTDAFPPNQRGLALGLNNVVGISGQFIGLVVGGLLAPVDWRLVFLVSVPFGLLGTVWSRRKLREIGVRNPAPIDWAGNVTFAVGLVLVMIGITYGIRPYGHSTTGWTSPFVDSCLAVGVALIASFAFLESRIAHPMFKLPLFRIRAFTFGVLSSFLSAIARGGLMFMLIIWLQGIWLPQHGYSFARTPLWAGIYMLPLTIGFLLAGPVSGFLSDRFGARPFATSGMIGSALSFVLLDTLPVNFSYPVFAGALLLMGLSMGAFASPNRAGVMNSLPASDRGAGGAMNQTFQNGAQVLSIGIFFTLMILGLAATLPTSLAAGLEAHGVPAATAQHAAHLPPVSVLFAAFLGYDPVRTLVGPSVVRHLSAANAAAVSNHSFFPNLIAEPFRSGLHKAFAFAIIACALAALMSWSRGARSSETHVPVLAESSEPDTI